MDTWAISFESEDLLVVRNAEFVMFRCPTLLTDLGDNEPLDAFMVRHGDLEATVCYLDKLLREETKHITGLRHSGVLARPADGVSLQLALEIQKPENRERARRIIMDVINSERFK